MEKVWLKNYPKDVPAEINPYEYESIVDIFEQTVKKFADKNAFTNLRHSITYAELDKYTRDFAAYLQKELGMQKGQRLAIMMPNTIQYPIALFGAMRAGLTVVNVNPLYTARELEHQLKDSGAEAIVIIANFASTLEKVLAKTSIKNVIVTQLGDMLPFPKSAAINFLIKHVKKMVPKWQIPSAIKFTDTLNKGAKLELTHIPTVRDDIAFLQYTGGTTGVAKGAILSHGNMVANVMQASSWMKHLVNEGEEIIVTPLPLYHIFALTANCLTFMIFGGENFLITNPRDIDRFVGEISRIPFTAITGVNTLFNGLINHPDFRKIDFSSLRLSLAGGMATQKVVAEKWQEITNCVLLEAYGLTETCPAVCINPPGSLEFNGTIGLPLPSTEISIRDDDGNELSCNEPGELCIRGPQVMQGYWNRAEETSKVVSLEGWLKTGDVAMVTDEGFVKIVDRKKDMIIVSGFNVYPNEIEDIVATHPGVLEVAAVGIPDEKSGEAVKLFIAKKDASLTKNDILELCRVELTGYKVPKHIEFREELPKTPVGKILRRELKVEA